jgi:beta-alanine degradation protein BauB
MSETHDNVGTNIMFEDEHVRVWDFSLAPGETLPWHIHRTNYVYIILDGGKLRAIDPEDPSKFKDGEYVPGVVRYVPVDGERVDPTFTNIGDTTYRNLVIELKKQD